MLTVSRHFNGKQNKTNKKNKPPGQSVRSYKYDPRRLQPCMELAGLSVLHLFLHTVVKYTQDTKQFTDFKNQH